MVLIIQTFEKFKVNFSFLKLDFFDFRAYFISQKLKTLNDLALAISN
jgi:hypothetical protein